MFPEMPKKNIPEPQTANYARPARAAHVAGAVYPKYTPKVYENYTSDYNNPYEINSLADLLYTTFNPNMERTPLLGFEKVPIFINATPLHFQDSIEKTALKLSPNVHFLADEKRVALHVAAVFVNNFTNHLFHIGKTITEKNDLPFDALKPLIEQTILKIQNQEPKAVQTGPAIRGDVNTIKKHLTFLKD